MAGYCGYPQRTNKSLELLSRATPPPEKLKPGYFFFGPEAFAAESFIDRVIEGLKRGTKEEIEVNRFYLDENIWGEVLDAARTSSLFSAVRRVFVVKIPEKAPKVRGKQTEAPEPEKRVERGEDGLPGLLGRDDEPPREEGREEEEEASTKKVQMLDKTDRADLERYFASPAEKTTIFILRTGNFKPTDSQVRFFSSLPAEAVEVAELADLKFYEIVTWLNPKVAGLGKTMSNAALRRLVQVAGLDPRLLLNELDKLAAFVGDRKDIGEEDVERVTAWSREHENYALGDALLGGSFPEAAAILNDMLDEGDRPELLIGHLAAFLRRLAMASTWLREKKMSREEIFQHFNPMIKPHFSFYQEKFNRFFGCLARLGPEKLGGVTEKLQEVDARIKSTETDPGILLELFLFEYFKTVGR